MLNMAPAPSLGGSDIARKYNGGNHQKRQNRIAWPSILFELRQPERYAGAGRRGCCCQQSSAPLIMACYQQKLPCRALAGRTSSWVCAARCAANDGGQRKASYRRSNVPFSARLIISRRRMWHMACAGGTVGIASSAPRGVAHLYDAAIGVAVLSQTVVC